MTEQEYTDLQNLVMEQKAALDLLKEEVTGLKEAASFGGPLQTLISKLSPDLPEAHTAEDKVKKQAYMDWWPQTLAAYQETIQELVRVETNNATVTVVMIAGLRALMDAGYITLEQLEALVDPAQHVGLELIGITLRKVDPDAELSAEERYELEGVEEWDGQRIPQT